MDAIRKFLACFLLVIFALSKVTSLHVFTHQEADTASVENCSWCHISTVNPNDQFLYPELLELESEVYLDIYFESPVSIPAVADAKLISASLFSRPPPFLI